MNDLFSLHTPFAQYNPTGEDGWLYHQLLFSREGLTNNSHNLRIQVEGVSLLEVGDQHAMENDRLTGLPSSIILSTQSRIQVAQSWFLRAQVLPTALR